MTITIVELSTGYLRAQGNGPCNWAQWLKGAVLRDDDFFPEAGDDFRRALRAQLEPPPPEDV